MTIVNDPIAYLYSISLCSIHLSDLEDKLAESRDWDELLGVWKGWRDVTGPRMMGRYADLVELQNEAARTNSELSESLSENYVALIQPWLPLNPLLGCSKQNKIKPVGVGLRLRVRSKMTSLECHPVQQDIFILLFIYIYVPDLDDTDNVVLPRLRWRRRLLEVALRDGRLPEAVRHLVVPSETSVPTPTRLHTSAAQVGLQGTWLPWHPPHTGAYSG